MKNKTTPQTIGNPALTPGVAAFLRKVRTESALTELVQNADTYGALVNLSGSCGAPVAEDLLRAAFATRNAGVLARQMIRRGCMEHLSLAAVPEWDEDLWKRIIAMDLSAVAEQFTQYRAWSPDRTARARGRALSASFLSFAHRPCADADDENHFARDSGLL